MTNEQKTWDEVMAKQIEDFEDFLKASLKDIDKLKVELLDSLTTLVELAKKVYEPGMDYYGTDTLSQMGVGRKLAELDTMVNPEEVENILKELIKKAKSRIQDYQIELKAKA